MDALRRISLLALVLITIPFVRAQNEITLLSPVNGNLSGDATDEWSFFAFTGAMLSFRVTAISGDLDPQLRILDSNGNQIYQNDDLDYPVSLNAGLEAVTMPQSGSYTLQISAVGEGSGSYTLEILPGFADLSDPIDFEQPDAWASQTDTASIFTGNQRLALELISANQDAVAYHAGGPTSTDQYIRVNVPEIEAQGVWQVGLVTRYQNGHYYALLVNEDGLWQFKVHTGEEERVIRDWRSHPAIVPGAVGFNLALLANGSGFEFFYDDQLIGSANDDTLTEPGQAGLIVATDSALDSEIIAQFESMSMTTPAQPRRPVQQILSGPSSVVIPALQRHRLIPASGQISLLVPESFLTFGRPGVNEFLLGSGDQQFRNFALGTTVNWEFSTPNLAAGCGLMLRAQDESDYLLAYVDQTGGYGLSARQEDGFAPGIFGERPSLEGNQHRLLVIANEGRLLYYVDGQLAGTLQSEAVSGRVGNAVVNFETVTTSCQFTETWVWTWN